MNSFSSRLVVLCFAFFLLSVSSVKAQDLDSVSISGSVTDQNGAVIPGTVIELTVLGTNKKRTVSSGDDGSFRIIQLEPGTYSINAVAAGFAAVQLDPLSLLSGQSRRLTIELLPETVTTETVVITSGDLPVIDTRKTIVGNTIAGKETEALPLANRSILDVVLTLPGVTEEPLSTRDLAEDRNSNPNQTPEEAGTVSLAGAPAYSNNFTIDGLDNNDDRSARERFQPMIDSLAEVQVITNQFSAEYGRASGGRINLRTRGGSNDFRGRAFYHFRDEALNANSYRNNSLGLARLPLQDHIAGFTFGGPVKLPRVAPPSSFFFVGYELSKTLDNALIDTLVPVSQNKQFSLPAPTMPALTRLEDVNEPALAAEVAPYIFAVNTPSRVARLTARLDHQVTSLHNVSMFFQRGRLKNLRQFGGGNRLAEALQAATRNSDAFSFSDDFVLSPAIINQARFQYSQLKPGFKSSGSGSPVVLITLNDPMTTDDPLRRSGTLVAGSSSSGGSERREARWQVQEILSFLSGNHSVKAGVDYHRVASEFTDLADVSGTFSFASAGDFLGNTPSRFRQSFKSVSTQRNSYLGVFAHDEWQVHPRVLLSYGLRYERESIIRDLDNFGPRLSVAYSPSDGSLVLRFGAGLFYNRALLRTIDDFTLGKQQLFFDTNTLHDPVTGKLLTSAQRRSFIAGNLQFPGTLQPDSPLVKEFGSLNTNFSRRLDPDLKIPESYQFNFGLEKDLGSGFSFETNFSFTRGIHLWREFNANAPRLPSGYRDFTAYLLSRDFPNFASASNVRPIFNASTAGELIRFRVGPSAANTSAVERVVEFGVPVSVFDLSSTNSTTTLEAALAALNPLRPDQSRAEVEQLISAGNSFYRGMTLELRRRFVPTALPGITFRLAYTLSKLIDDGVVNTSDALVPADFRRERARSLVDRRHRFVLAGVFETPSILASLQFAPILRLASGAPFNISIGGSDRNLDDVGNDRPNFAGDLSHLKWRAPGSELSDVLRSFSLPLIGRAGNLPRNAGIGPATFSFDLNVSREFRIGERVVLRPVVEFDNVLNKTVFSFGSEFVDFKALAPTATEELRQSFLESFLLATRTMRPRQIRLGLKIDF
ncbi:MAG TPA: TonB-dependent receptor [Pyrinomonadaceae bacterium]|nr:TonB-dependent receptor [Pyrinomonadaceae bacterium]